jgi:hypothetical protein
MDGARLMATVSLGRVGGAANTAQKETRSDLDVTRVSRCGSGTQVLVDLRQRGVGPSWQAALLLDNAEAIQLLNELRSALVVA